MYFWHFVQDFFINVLSRFFLSGFTFLITKILFNCFVLLLFLRPILKQKTFFICCNNCGLIFYVWYNMILYMIDIIFCNCTFFLQIYKSVSQTDITTNALDIHATSVISTALKVI